MKNLSGRVKPEDIIAVIIVLVVFVAILCCGVRSGVEESNAEGTTLFDNEIEDKRRYWTDDEWWNVYLREHGMTQEEFDERCGDKDD